MNRKTKLILLIILLYALTVLSLAGIVEILGGTLTGVLFIKLSIGVLICYAGFFVARYW